MAWDESGRDRREALHLNDARLDMTDPPVSTRHRGFSEQAVSHLTNIQSVKVTFVWIRNRDVLDDGIRSPHEDIMSILFKLQITVHHNQRGENPGPIRDWRGTYDTNKQWRIVRRGDITATIQLGT